MELNGILIGSDDPRRLVDYYAKLLGDPGWDGGGYVGWQLGSGYLTIGPHDQVHGSNQEPGRLIWNLESQDVQGDFERFQAAGATVIAEPYGMDDAPGAQIATLADPDGNYFQLISPMEPPPKAG